MIEYEDGKMSEIMSKQDALRKAMLEPNVKSVHLGTFEHLEKKKEQVGKIEVLEDHDQLNRIEKMLSAIIFHLKIPYKGIINP